MAAAKVWTRTDYSCESNPMADKLIYIDDDLPGITRKRAGRGWAYYDAKGKHITDREEIDRLNAIALPPAYEDAWFCPAPNGHILATGIDDKGRKQYRYHPDFRAAREAEKYEACADFGRALPLLRQRLEQDLRARSLSRERAIAAVVRLLDLSALRVGNESYAVRNKSFGATTLRRRHARLTGTTVRLRFPAKSGQQREVAITDRSLSTIVRRMQDLPGQKLFQYVDGAGDPHPVTSTDVNDYIREAMGDDFTAKNFRTWAASLAAFQRLVDAKSEVAMKDLLDHVSGSLGNTPAIARKSYIHPAMLAVCKDEQAEFRKGLRLPRATRYLNRYERGLIEYLESAPCAEELLAAA